MPSATKHLTVVNFVLLTLVFTLCAFKLKAPKEQSRHLNFQAQTDTVPGIDTAIFQEVEQEAYFPGGHDGWVQFLTTNLNGDVPITKGAPAGLYTVYVQFVVSKTGQLSDFKALTKHGFGMEAEVLRTIKKSPNWVPAVQNGRTVNAYRKQPVTFQVIDERKKRKKDRD